MEQKVAVYRKEHFNAAHRLFCADWSDEKIGKFLEPAPTQITTDIITN